MNTKTKRRLKAILTVLGIYGTMAGLAFVVTSIPDSWLPYIVSTLVGIGVTAFFYYMALDIITAKEQQEEWENKHK
jgi:hypothetical protein